MKRVGTVMVLALALTATAALARDLADKADEQQTEPWYRDALEKPDTD